MAQGRLKSWGETMMIMNEREERESERESSLRRVALIIEDAVEAPRNLPELAILPPLAPPVTKSTIR